MKLQGLIVDKSFIATVAPVPVVKEVKEVEVFVEVPVYGNCAYAPSSAFAAPSLPYVTPHKKPVPKSAIAMMMVTLVGAIVKHNSL